MTCWRVFCFPISGGGQGCSNPGVMGVGSLWKAKGERVGDGISKEAGAGRNKKLNFATLRNFLQ